ncbi:uncharacterized protein LOC135817166 [Sycon ciliatum]|uniref:uncharacterized protein LOC135817166 n=1 Tax=Sycon ciliatum TaxID=27933 RepID=UPI0031F67F5B
MVERIPTRIRSWGGRPLTPKPKPYVPYVPKLAHPRSFRDSRIKTKDLLKNIIKYERIITTYHNALVTKHWGEKLIDKVKNGEWDAMREAKIIINEGETIEKLCLELPVRYLRQDGDYIDIYRIPNRLRDGARMAIVELQGNPYPSLYPALGLGAEPDAAEVKEKAPDRLDAPMKWKFVEYPDDPLPEGVPKISADQLDQMPPRTSRRKRRPNPMMQEQHAGLVKEHFEGREDYFKQLMMSKKERDAVLAKRAREAEVSMPWLHRRAWDIQGIKTVADFNEFIAMVDERREKVLAARKRQAEEDAAAATSSQGEDGTAV